MVSEDDPKPKSVKKIDPPATPAEDAGELLSFDDFEQWVALAPVWSEGLRMYLAYAPQGLRPRPLDEWQLALAQYQALA